MFCNCIASHSMSCHCPVSVCLSHSIKDYLLTYLYLLFCQANEKLNAAKKAVNVIEQEKLIAEALDVSLSLILVVILCRFSLVSYAQDVDGKLFSGHCSVTA